MTNLDLVASVEESRVSTIYAVDFGTGSALQIYGPEGPVSKKSLNIPRVKGGKTPRDEFYMLLGALLRLGDVVVESPTIGSSGAEVGDVLDLVNQSVHTLWTVSARAVKNYRADYGLAWRKGARYVQDGAPPPVVVELHDQEEVHKEDAEIIYRIATETPWRLRKWHIAEPAGRVFTSVRPSDKRGYRDERSENLMKCLPPFSELPEDIQAVVGVKGGYSRPLAIPLAMALNEPYLKQGPKEETRKRFQKILGLYDHGYPSFYRRMTIDWMQEVAKSLANVPKMEMVPREVRKQAWKITQRQLRQMFFLASNL